MDNYIVSARKYRPSSFKTVVGQKSLTHTLKSAIESNRLAHAYLFCGPRGVGKTSCARIFAKTINCLNPTSDKDACNCCESCVAFNEQRSYNIVEMDAASNNSVDNMRTLTEQVRIPPQVGKYKVFIIDEVHMLSPSAFNAFLKTLEEPPAHAIFILATTEKHKIIPTILSRCQIYDFSRITVQDMVEQLKFIAQNEGIQADTQSLNIIAQKADGAMRDALSIFDQVAAFSQGVITYASTIENLNVLDYEYYFRLVDAFIAADVPQALLIYNEIRCNGFDSLFFINGLASHIRDLMVASNSQTISLLELGDAIKERYLKQAQSIPVSFIYKSLNICNDCDVNYRVVSNKQLQIELSLVKLCQILDTPAQDVKEQGEKLKPIAPTTNTIPAQPVVAPQQSVAPKSIEPKSIEPKSIEPKNSVVTPSSSIVTSNTVVAQQPVVAPKPSPSPRIPSAPRISISGVNPSNRDSNNTTASATKVTASAAAKSAISVDRNFSDTDFVNVWERYIQSNPTEHLLINAMRISTPTRVADTTTFNMELSNIGLVEVVKSNLGKLLTYLRSNLDNNNINIETTVNEDIETVRHLSPTDIIADIMERSPRIRTLIDKFELGLA